MMLLRRGCSSSACSMVSWTITTPNFGHGTRSKPIRQRATGDFLTAIDFTGRLASMYVAA